MVVAVAGAVVVVVVVVSSLLEQPRRPPYSNLHCAIITIQLLDSKRCYVAVVVVWAVIVVANGCDFAF